MCNLFAKFPLNFCGSATYRNGKEKKTFHHRFLLPKSKNTYSRKGLSTPPQGFTPDIYFTVH